MLEIQRWVDKKNYLAELYKKQLPIFMVRTIEEWTSGQYLLEAVEASSPNNGSEFIYISSQKKWASRVIQEKKTTPTSEELVDFISTTRFTTYSFVKIQRDETDKEPEKTYFVYLRNGSHDYDKCFR